MDSLRLSDLNPPYIHSGDGELITDNTENNMADNKKDPKKKSSTSNKKPSRRGQRRKSRSQKPKKKSFEAIINQFLNIKVMVIGDFISDEYIFWKAV